MFVSEPKEIEDVAIAWDKMMKYLFIALFWMLFSLSAHSEVLMLRCGDVNDKYSNKYELIIDLTSSTFTLYRNGTLDESDEQLASVSSAKITLYSSYGGSEMFVDRVNGSLTIIRRTYPCVRVHDISTTPKF